jgi:hypothetical protein
VEVIEKGGDAAGTSEEEEDDFLAAAVLVAACAGGNDDPGVASSPSARPGNDVLPGEGSIRGRGGAAVCTPAGLDAVFQLPAQETASVVSPHVAPGVGVGDGGPGEGRRRLARAPRPVFRPARGWYLSVPPE